MLRRLAALCWLFALGLLGWGGFRALAPSEDHMGLTVEAPSDLGERPVGESVVVIRVKNPTSQSGEILSLAVG